MITILLALTGASVTAAIVLTAYQFIRDVRRAGGLRALYAELTGTVFPPKRQEIPWWLETRPGSLRPPAPQAATQNERLPRLWEAVHVARTAGGPPWDAEAPSQGTGYTKYHAEDLRDLLKGEPS